MGHIFIDKVLGFIDYADLKLYLNNDTAVFVYRSRFLEKGKSRNLPDKSHALLENSANFL